MNFGGCSAILRANTKFDFPSLLLSSTSGFIVMVGLELILGYIIREYIYCLITGQILFAFVETLLKTQYYFAYFNIENITLHFCGSSIGLRIMQIIFHESFKTTRISRARVLNHGEE